MFCQKLVLSKNSCFQKLVLLKTRVLSKTRTFKKLVFCQKLVLSKNSCFVKNSYFRKTRVLSKTRTFYRIPCFFKASVFLKNSPFKVHFEFPKKIPCFFQKFPVREKLIFTNSVFFSKNSVFYKIPRFSDF